MSGKHRSIGEWLNRAKSLDARRETALDWWENWYRDHASTLRRLELALGDHAEAGPILGQLKTLDEKAMSALPRIIAALTDEDVA